MHILHNKLTEKSSLQGRKQTYSKGRIILISTRILTMPNYKILINKQNKISSDFIDALKLIDVVDVNANPCKLEQRTNQMYNKLKRKCEEKGIYIGLDSTYRSLQEQKDIYERFCKRYGREYADKTVAPVGTSEHHSALAIDLTISLDNGKTYLQENAELIKNDTIFKEIHKLLPTFGFILRYPENKENITGYKYEPWHIRYVGLVAAKSITKKGLCLEEYCQQIDLGRNKNSKLNS